MLNLNCENIENNIKNVLENINEFEYSYVSNNINDTVFLATIFAKHLKKSDILVLNGELGSGKTVFMSGIAKYFDIEDQISSPTFTIVNEYNLFNNNTNDNNYHYTNNDKIYHFDVYRIEDSEEFLDSIGTEYFSDGICIIEWGNIIKDILPKNTIYIDITKDDTDYEKRYFKIWRK